MAIAIEKASASGGADREKTAVLGSARETSNRLSGGGRLPFLDNTTLCDPTRSPPATLPLAASPHLLLVAAMDDKLDGFFDDYPDVDQSGCRLLGPTALVRTALTHRGSSPGLIECVGHPGSHGRAGHCLPHLQTASREPETALANMVRFHDQRGLVKISTTLWFAEGSSTSRSKLSGNWSFTG